MARYASQQAYQSKDDYISFPYRIKSAALCYKAIFICLLGVGMFLIWRLRGNDLIGRNGAVDADLAFGYVFTAAMALAAFMLVQGSDPGYIYDAALNKAEAELRRKVKRMTTAARHRATAIELGEARERERRMAGRALEDDDEEAGLLGGAGTSLGGADSKASASEGGSMAAFSETVVRASEYADDSRGGGAAGPASGAGADDMPAPAPSGARASSASGATAGHLPSAGADWDFATGHGAHSAEAKYQEQQRRFDLEARELGLDPDEIRRQAEREMYASTGSLRTSSLRSAGAVGGEGGGVGTRPSSPGEPPLPGVPVRAHFCSASDRWVHGFDHYCGFLGTSIGERNHCRFWWFLFLMSLAMGVGIGIVQSGFHEQRNWNYWYEVNAGHFWANIYLWVFQAFVFPLLCFHTWLALARATGYELSQNTSRIWYLRHTMKCDFPFSRGVLANVRVFCCEQDGLCWVIRGKEWKAKSYSVPGPVVRDSDDVCEHPWQNRYYTCC